MPLIALALTVALLQAMPIAGGSTIRGRVLDADGQPMADVEMRAMLITTERESVVGSLKPAGKITGRVVADRGGVPPIDGLRVAASWTDGTIDLDPLATDQADVGPDGSFAIDGLFGRRAIRVGGVNAGWQVAAIRHGRTDITTSMVEIDHGSTIEVVITLTRR